MEALDGCLKIENVHFKLPRYLAEDSMTRAGP